MGFELAFTDNFNPRTINIQSRLFAPLEPTFSRPGHDYRTLHVFATSVLKSKYLCRSVVTSAWEELEGPKEGYLPEEQLSRGLVPNSKALATPKGDDGHVVSADGYTHDCDVRRAFLKSTRRWVLLFSSDIPWRQDDCTSMRWP